ncbi:MAG: ABC transporter ATP-binding protein, partial [Bacteroidota bacterium]|nr:ABC transporter ATP-binding protein [Bacteroidota bacterium]
VSFEERKEINKNLSRIEKSIEKTEKQIADLESDIVRMDKMLADSNGNDPEVFTKYDRMKKDLEHRMYEWEVLSQELEEISRIKTW